MVLRAPPSVFHFLHQGCNYARLTGSTVFRDPILTRLSQVLPWLRHARPTAGVPFPQTAAPGSGTEDRLAAASLTDAVGQVTIILDNPNESLTIAATATAHQYSLNSPSGTLFNTSLTGAIQRQHVGRHLDTHLGQLDLHRR